MILPEGSELIASLIQMFMYYIIHAMVLADVLSFKLVLCAFENCK